MYFAGLSGGLPDFAEGAGSECDDPSGEELLKGGEAFGPCEAGTEGVYQNEEGGNQLIPDTGFLPSGTWWCVIMSPYPKRRRRPVFICRVTTPSDVRNTSAR